jgi:hypothetical protein
MVPMRRRYVPTQRKLATPKDGGPHATARDLPRLATVRIGKPLTQQYLILSSSEEQLGVILCVIVASISPFDGTLGG